MSEHSDLLKEVDRLLGISHEKIHHHLTPLQCQKENSEFEKQSDLTDSQGNSSEIIDLSNRKNENLTNNENINSDPHSHQNTQTENSYISDSYCVNRDKPLSVKDVRHKANDINEKKDDTEIKLMPGFKHRFYQRTLPAPPQTPISDTESLQLSILSRPRMSAKIATRNRVGGKMGEKARATSPTEEKRREQAILRRAREAAKMPRTAASIPIKGKNHINLGQSNRMRGPYQKELDEHARLHPKPLAFMETSEYKACNIYCQIVLNKNVNFSSKKKLEKLGNKRSFNFPDNNNPSAKINLSDQLMDSNYQPLAYWSIAQNY